MLQVGSLYVKFKYEAKKTNGSTEDSLRIMFIGDSWMQGFDAFPEQPGHADLAIQELKKAFPEKNIQGFNLGLAGINSSQALHMVLDNYQKIRPHILVIMTGANDVYNNEDRITASKRIRNIVHIDNIYYSIPWYENIFAKLNALRTIKLSRILWYNLIYKPKEMKNQFRNNSNNKEAVVIFFNILNEDADSEEYRARAREYLLEKYKDGTLNYDEFYSFTVFSFKNDRNKAHEYLKNNNLLNLRLIKKDLGERYVGSLFEILKDNLTYLKLFCDQEGIIMVIENYPHFLLHGDINDYLDSIAKSLGAFYVDQRRYFKENLTWEEWKELSTKAHVNYKGHEYMARNLAAILSGIIKEIGSKGSKR